MTQDQISKLNRLGAMTLDGTRKAIELAVSHAREGKSQLVFSSGDSFGKEHKKRSEDRHAYCKKMYAVLWYMRHI